MTNVVCRILGHRPRIVHRTPGGGRLTLCYLCGKRLRFVGSDGVER